jgi:ABC-type nickel/cobalt efflux system permease component RcnA
MQRSNTVSPKRPAAAAQIPDTHAVLQAALAASWQRDRRVGQQRVMLRWLIWGLWRCVLAVLVFTAAWVVWRYHWLMPEIQTQPGARSQPNHHAVQQTFAQTTQPADYVVLETTATHQHPSLKPTNRLHSKEP